MMYHYFANNKLSYTAKQITNHKSVCLNCLKVSGGSPCVSHEENGISISMSARDFDTFVTLVNSNARE